MCAGQRGRQTKLAAIYQMTHESALFIVATPIGNLSDITQRAIDVLRNVSVVAAEDTRHSSRLLRYFDIQTPLMSYHDYGGEGQLERILNKLRSGESVALISDAGTPLISDPGYRIVKASRQSGFKVVPIPGACAFVAAICASGLPSDHFSFEGFLPAKSAARLSELEKLTKARHTLIFYESTHRILESLSDMAKVFGGQRECVLAREITKTFETFIDGTLQSVITTLGSDANQQKGEFVVIVEGARADVAADEISEDGKRIIEILLGDLPVKQAAALTSKISGDKKNKLYQWALLKRS